MTHWPCDLTPQLIYPELIPGANNDVYLTGLDPEDDGTVAYHIDETEIRQINLPHDGALRVAPNGDLWLLGGPATTGDPETRPNGPLWLSRHDGHSWTTFEMELSFAGELESGRLAIGPDSRAWVATGSSLALFDGTDWSHPLVGEEIDVVDVAPDGSVWVVISDTLQHFPAEWSAR